MQSSKLNHFHGFLFGTGDSLGILDFNFTKSGEVGNFDHFLVLNIPSWLEVSDLVQPEDASVKARALLGEALVLTPLPWLDLYPSSETSELESQVDKVSFDDFLMGLAELPGDSLMLPKPEGCNDEDLANCKAKK